MGSVDGYSCSGLQRYAFCSVPSSLAAEIPSSCFLFRYISLFLLSMKPLKFHAVLVPKLWGGDAIARLKGIDGAPAYVGESFEISALSGQETYCSTEGYCGRTLPQLIEEYGARLVGARNYSRFGTQFPLLVKFIDARQALSVQVHPDDALARELGMPYGKSEMWYVASTQPEASLMAGFCEDVNPDQFEQMLADGTLMGKANRYETQAGDAFYIPAGTLHSIGAGNLIVEVQQSSGATYRVYDFDRKDELGRKRELHVELARRALNFKAGADYHHRVSDEFGHPVPVVQSPYFTTQALRLSAPYMLPLADLDSFVIMVCYCGNAELVDDCGNVVDLRTGETLLVPACTQSLAITPRGAFSCLMAFV